MAKTLRSELERRLIKLADGELSYVPQPNMNNSQVGQIIGQHLQYLGAINPSSPEGQAYIQQHNIPMDAAKLYWQRGQDLQNYARTNMDWGAGPEGFNFAALSNAPPVTALQDAMQRGFDTNSQMRLLQQNPSTQGFFNSQGKLNHFLGFGGAFIPKSLGGLSEDLEAGIPGIRKDILLGMGRSFDLNSPLSRALIANAGTGYLRSKLDEWAPRNSTWGQAFNSFGNLALGLASMMPGYENIMNWLANWQYGDKFKQLQANLNSGAQFNPQSLAQSRAPSPAQPPAQPRAQPRAQPPAPPTAPPTAPPLAQARPQPPALPRTVTPPPAAVAPRFASTQSSGFGGGGFGGGYSGGGDFVGGFGGGVSPLSPQSSVVTPQQNNPNY